MSNFQRGGRQGGRGGFNSVREQQGPSQNSGISNSMNRMNNSEFNNRSMPLNRVNPWDVSPGGNNMDNMRGNICNNNMGNNNLGNNHMGSNNMNNVGGNRSSGGLLPTPNMPAMTGLLQPPSMQDVQLAMASKVLNLFLPNIQNQQTNQLPSLLGPSPNCNGLLPLSPPVMNPFNQNFRGQGHQGSMDSNRVARPNIASRRPEPYNKVGNRNQRPGQKSDDRKTSNVSPRRAIRGPGLSPKNVQHTKNVKDEKGDSRKNQKSDNSDKEVIDNRDKRLSEKQEHEKIRAEFTDIPCDMLTCHVCEKNVGDSVSFINHVKGKAHLNMIDRQEEQYKAHTEKLRHQMKIEEQQRQISLGQNSSYNRSAQPSEYCTMCNLHFNGNLAQHRKGPKHQQLKSFLHPRCNTCDKEFPTRIDYDHHLLTVGHLKTVVSKTKKETQREDAKKSSNLDDGKISDNNAQNTEKFARPEAVVKKPSNNCDSLTTSTKVAIKTEGRKNETGNSKSTESVNSKFPDYDSQKEIGMEMLQEKTGYLCKCCNRFLSSSSDAKTHCKSQFHYDKYITYMKSQPSLLVSKSPKQNGNEKSPCDKSKSKAYDKKDETLQTVDDTEGQVKGDLMPNADDEKEKTISKVGEKMDVTKPEYEVKPKEDGELEEEEEDEEDEGNWKRRKIVKDDDLSMDTTLVLNKAKSAKDARSQELTISVVKDANDETGEDAAISSDINEDLEETLLLEDIPGTSSVYPRGREESSV